MRPTSPVSIFNQWLNPLGNCPDLVIGVVLYVSPKALQVVKNSDTDQADGNTLVFLPSRASAYSRKSDSPSTLGERQINGTESGMEIWGGLATGFHIHYINSDSSQGAFPKKPLHNDANTIPPSQILDPSRLVEFTMLAKTRTSRLSNAFSIRVYNNVSVENWR